MIILNRLPITKQNPVLNQPTEFYVRSYPFSFFVNIELAPGTQFTNKPSVYEINFPRPCIAPLFAHGSQIGAVILQGQSLAVFSLYLCGEQQNGQAATRHWDSYTRKHMFRET